MMKNLTLLAFLLVTTHLLSAQSVNFGIKGGLNESYVDRGPLIAGNKGYVRTGFHAGVFAEFEFKKWAVQPGIFYTVKGFRGTSDYVQATPGGPANVSISGTQTYSYMELPVNLLYNIKIKSGKISVGGGPYMGYLLAAYGKRTTNVNGTITYIEPQYAIGSNGTFKRTDFGLNAQTGISFKNGVLFSIGYSYGLTNIVANTTLVANTPATTKNRVLSISAGYAF